MANTYSSVYLHIVFAVKNRQALLDKSWRGDLFAYVSGILNKRGHYSLAVNGYHDHIHIFFRYSMKELVSDLVREIKKSSNQYINDNNLSPTKFEWQKGYGVFSNGYREVSTIINYIKNQEEHHQKRSFKKEYLSLLEKYEIEFKEEYIFNFHDE